MRLDAEKDTSWADIRRLKVQRGSRTKSREPQESLEVIRVIEMTPRLSDYIPLITGNNLIFSPRGSYGRANFSTDEGGLRTILKLKLPSQILSTLDENNSRHVRCISLSRDVDGACSQAGLLLAAFGSPPPSLAALEVGVSPSHNG